MTVIKIRLCEGDRLEYGCDEELSLDVESLKDLRADEHSKIDEAIGTSMALFIPMMESPGPTLAVAHVARLAAWLALRSAGIDIEWAKFQPRLMRAAITREGDDEPRPPVGGPSGDSSETPPPKLSSTPSSHSSASKRTSRR